MLLAILWLLMIHSSTSAQRQRERESQSESASASCRLECFRMLPAQNLRFTKLWISILAPEVRGICWDIQVKLGRPANMKSCPGNKELKLSFLPSSLEFDFPLQESSILQSLKSMFLIPFAPKESKVTGLNRSLNEATRKPFGISQTLPVQF